MKCSMHRALAAVAALTLLVLASAAMSHRAFAQEPFYDVKVMTPAEGNNGELPLSFDVNFDSPAVPQQHVEITAEGRTSFAIADPNASVTSIVFNNIVYPYPGPHQIPWLGGCWRVCIKCVPYWPWWWYRRCYIVWYWDPCC